MMESSGITLYGTTIVFREGMTREAAEEIIRRMVRANLLESEPPKVREFDPEWGYPTFYIP